MIITAATAELSIELAMDPYFVDMPDVLVGTVNRAGEENVKIVHEPVAEVEPELAEEGMEILKVEEDVILESLIDNELVEVIGFTTTEGVTWAMIRTESGALFDVPENEWVSEYGEDGELEIMSAYDRASMINLRKSFNLVTV